MSFKENPNKIERTSRTVIEKKLLTALDEENKVAILATKQDLEDMICALMDQQPSIIEYQRRKDLAAGMSQLLLEAYPPNNEVSEPARDRPQA